MSITAIKNHIVFQFIDPVNTKGEFEEGASAGGIYIKGGYDRSAKLPRWAMVTSAGGKCEHVKVGDLVLIPALRWTEGVKHDDQYFWKTDETQIVGYKSGDEFFPINEHALFIPNKEVISQHSSGLVVISHQSDDTPSGKVVFIAADCEDDLKGATIYYNTANFFNEFEIDGIELSFIKQDEIWAYAPKGE
jgi:co-chaperonin GroES (HSP10)